MEHRSQGFAGERLLKGRRKIQSRVSLDRLRRGVASIQAKVKATANTLTAATMIIANSKEPNSMVPPLATAVRPSFGAPLIKHKNSESNDKARCHHHGNEELPHSHSQPQ
jgi:hypothetical protein